MRVLYKGHAFLKSVFTLYLRRIIAASIRILDIHKFRVFVYCALYILTSIETGQWSLPYTSLWMRAFLMSGASTFEVIT